MKRSSTVFLQAVIVLIGIGALAFLLWEPHVEGRNANTTLFQIYFNDPFLTYAYAASLAFFIGMYQTFKVLGYIRKNKTFSQATVQALQTIRYCGVIIMCFVVAGEIYLFTIRSGDDIAGGVFMGLLIAFGSMIAVATAAMFEGIVHDGISAEKP